jgi:hypothetical protein
VNSSGQSRLEEFPGAAIRDQRAHLAGQLAAIAVEEALVLPIDAHRVKEGLAVEIGADPDLGAADMRHQDEARLACLLPRAPIDLEQRDDVLAVLHLADIGLHRFDVAAVRLVDVAPAVAPHEIDGVYEIVEFIRRHRGDAGLAQDRLAEGTVVLQPIAEGAAADDVVAVSAQRILGRPGIGGLEQDDAVLPGGPHPGQLRPPVVDALDQPGEGLGAARIGDVDADLVAFRHQPQIEVAEIGVIADAEKAHRCLETEMSAVALEAARACRETQ